MRLLLDTSALIWWADDVAHFDKVARETVEQADAVLFSIVSLWEIAIKPTIGKLSTDLGALTAGLNGSGFELLPITPAHCLTLLKLPLLHRDPFDRMLVAQALEGELTLLTSDRTIPLYAGLGLAVVECG